jgi:hypothetical protein
VVDLAQGRIESPVVIENRAGAVDVERRSIFLRDAFEIHAFAMQAAVLITKRVHVSGCVDAEIAQTRNENILPARPRIGVF